MNLTVEQLDGYWRTIVEDEELNTNDYWDSILADGFWHGFDFQYGGSKFQVENYVDVNPVGQKKSPKYRLAFKCFEIKVRDLNGIPFREIPSTIVEILEFVLETVLKDVESHELVRIQFESACLKWPIWTPPIQRSQLSVDRWMSEIEKVLNSHEELTLDETIKITVQHTEIPQGSCRLNVSNMLYKKLGNITSLVKVPNVDELCLARAVVIGKAYADGDLSLFRKLRRGSKLWSKMTHALLFRMALEKRCHNLTDLPLFAQCLPEYQFVVVSSDHMNSVVYSGEVKTKRIILLHHNRHFDFLKSLPAFFKRSYWCYSCQKGFNDRASHRCSSTCLSCLRRDCARDTVNQKTCTDCRRVFYGDDCYAQHKDSNEAGGPKAKRSLCSMIYMCTSCLCTVSLARRKPESVHQCGEYFCVVCEEHVLPQEHKCFMRPHILSAEELDKNANTELLFYDIETYVNPFGQLIPNLIVLQDMHGQEWIFPQEGKAMSESVCDEFCQFLFSSRFKNHYVVAHNFKAFDGYFILQWLLKSGIVPKVILNGGKILQLDVPRLNIRFRDSMNYNPQALAKWPSTFGLPNLAKGQFPHKFNRKENWDTVVDFPSMEEYGYENMSTSDKLQFCEWYMAEKKRKNGKFNFRKEITEYCRMDVTVLRVCCLKFRELFQNISGGLCPFVSALTIAGLCNLYWRTFVLEPNLIGLVPSNGYSRNRQQSSKALRWMEWIAVQSGYSIQTRSCGTEYKIGRFFVDGFCKNTNTVFEFYGCWYHGCEKCTEKETIHPYRDLTMGTIYEETKSRERYLESRGYTLVVIWEHEYDSLLKSDQAFHNFVRAVNVRPPLNPRDAFYGGRTNATKLHHKIQGDEKILYFDVCSEYPFVNKNRCYPVGHPEILTKSFSNLSSYFGIVSCTIVPPSTLYLPVLPYRSNGKLTFPLCRTCVENLVNADCYHPDSLRELTGTWCTPELLKAVEKGYSVRQIHEVWHFPRKQDKLFASYIDKFLKIKTEASGWPDGFETMAEKARYVAEFEEMEGIKLDPNKIAKNPGLRALSKLCLNSFWGRFGMQENKLTTEYIHDAQTFYDVLLSGKNRVHSWDLFTDDILQLTYTKQEPFVAVNANINVVLAAFTTCWARLHLYEFMDMVSDRLLYFDTDSIFFVHSPSKPDPPTGVFLGQLTSELRPNQHIVEFVSLGAKSYAYRTNDGACVVKIKGFTVSGKTAETLNFGNMLSMLKSGSRVTVKYPAALRRVKKSMTIKQTDQSKKFSVTYDKRRIVDSDFNTLPYGYCKQ